MRVCTAESLNELRPTFALGQRGCPHLQKSADACRLLLNGLIGRSEVPWWRKAIHGPKAQLFLNESGFHANQHI